MAQRTAFIRDWLRHRNVSAMSRVYGISRVTAYKWIARFHGSGEAGLCDRPRRPRRSPGATSAKVGTALIALRKRHPTWGPKKLVVIARREHPTWCVPAASTAGDILRRAGLVEPPRRRRRPVPSPVPGGRGSEPNEVWCVDYKGEFKLGNDRYCFPLTVSDEHTRYLLECQGYERISGADARHSFERLFQEHGLPRRIRSDNGSPFAGTGAARLSVLSVWWLRLGIILDRNQPHHPEQNGRHERMHRDLKAFATRPPERTFAAQQRCFDRFRHQHNHERPHEALGMAVPAEHYAPSVRPMPRQLPEIVYPGHYEIRLVDHSGAIRLRSVPIFLSHALRGERVGLVETDDGVWTISYANLHLGTFDARTRRFRPAAVSIARDGGD
jgi:transposase InsO family protein